jgi:hypothetical protein
MNTMDSISSDTTAVSRLLTALRPSGVVADPLLVNSEQAAACLQRFLFEELVRARHSVFFDTRKGRGSDLALLSTMYSKLSYEAMMNHLVFVSIPLDWEQLNELI